MAFLSSTPTISFPQPGPQLQSLLPSNAETLKTLFGLILWHADAIMDIDNNAQEFAMIIPTYRHFIKTVGLDTPAKPPDLAPPPNLNNQLDRKITAIESALASLTKSVKEGLKAHPPAKGTPPPKPPPTTAAPAPPGTPEKPSKPTYAALAVNPPRASVVVDFSSADWISPRRPRPVDLISNINNALAASTFSHVHVSAARWTKKNNLVITGGPNTMAQHLTDAKPTIIGAIQPFISAAYLKSALPSPPPLRPNVKWSRALLNRVPTGTTASSPAHSPENCHQALLAENPYYASLPITQKPSWVRSPSSYSPEAVSSLSFSFEDPDGTRLQTLLSSKVLYAFGHVAVVKRWKVRPPSKHVSDVPGDLAQATGPTAPSKSKRKAPSSPPGAPPPAPSARLQMTASPSRKRGPAKK